MNVVDLIEVVAKTLLSEVYVTGFVDRASPPLGTDRAAPVLRFTPVWDHVYFEFGGTLLLCQPVRHPAGLALSRVDQIVRLFEIDKEDQFCISRVLRSTLASGRDRAAIQAIGFFCEQERDAQECIGAAIELRLDRGESIFLDGLDLYGTHVGGREGREAWVRGVGKRYQEVSYAVR